MGRFTRAPPPRSCLRLNHLKFENPVQAGTLKLQDPYEMKNLIAEASLNSEIERHRAMLREWSVSVGEKRLPLDEAGTQPRKGKAKAAAKPKKQI